MTLPGNYLNPEKAIEDLKEVFSGYQPPWNILLPYLIIAILYPTILQIISYCCKGIWLPIKVYYWSFKKLKALDKFADEIFYDMGNPNEGKTDKAEDLSYKFKKYLWPDKFIKSIDEKSNDRKIKGVLNVLEKLVRKYYIDRFGWFKSFLAERGHIIKVNDEQMLNVLNKLQYIEHSEIPNFLDFLINNTSSTVARLCLAQINDEWLDTESGKKVIREMVSMKNDKISDQIYHIISTNKNIIGDSIILNKLKNRDFGFNLRSDQLKYLLDQYKNSEASAAVTKN